MSKPTGKCYENCGRFMLHLVAEEPDKWTLCHGTALGRAGEAKGIWFGHAWLEHDGEAIDMARDEFGPEGLRIPVEVFRQIGNVCDVTEYTPDEAILHMTRFKHFGPWEDAA